MRVPSRRGPALAVATFLVLAAVPGCDSKSPTAPRLTEGPIEWVVLLNTSQPEVGDSSGLLEQERRIVRTEAAMTTLWEDIFEPFVGDPPVEQPDVDFTEYMVLAVAAGEKPNTCHGIAVTGATSDGTDLTVTVTETVEGTGCACGQALVEPVEVVRVPRADEVFFVTVTDSSC